MCKFHEFKETLHRFDELVQQADMARAYIDITQKMGPSEQLIAFINYDGKLSEEIGIGMESFSVGTKHEILLSKLDPIALEAMALDVVDTWLNNHKDSKNSEIIQISKFVNKTKSGDSESAKITSKLLKDIRQSFDEVEKQFKESK